MSVPGLPNSNLPPEAMAWVRALEAEVKTLQKDNRSIHGTMEAMRAVFRQLPQATGDAKGWTSGSYDPGTGVVTFYSNDGLGFATDDLRGTDGTDGEGWTGASYNSSTGVVTFTSDDGLGFSTSDLRGADGIGIPPGGASGYVLGKDSTTNYDTSWKTVSPFAVANSMPVRDSGGRLETGAPVSGSDCINIAYFENLHADTGWVAISLNSGYSNEPGQTASYRKVTWMGVETVFFRGQMTRDLGVGTGAQNIATLPTSIVPNDFQRIFSIGLGNTAAGGRAWIDNGNQSLNVQASTATATYYDLSGISYIRTP